MREAAERVSLPHLSGQALAHRLFFPVWPHVNPSASPTEVAEFDPALAGDTARPSRQYHASP